MSLTRPHLTEWSLRFLILFSVILFSSGCQNTTTRDAIFINFKRPASRIDPAFASNQSNIRLSTNVFQTLVSLNASLELEYQLADTILIDSTATTYTVILDSSKLFSNGEQITSADVAYSFQRLINPETASPGSWVLEPYLSKDWIEIQSDHKFSISLKQAFSPFLQLLSLPYCGIIQKGSDSLHTPIGSGPYILNNSITDEFLTFTPNPYYPGSTQLTTEIIISSISDGATEFLSFLDQKTHLILDLDNSIAPLILNGSSVNQQFNSKMNLASSPFLNVEYLGFQLEATDCPNILLNKAFRTALAMAIPKQQFVSTVLGEKGEAANGGMIPNSFKAFQNVAYGIPYQQEKAKTIIDSLKGIGIQQNQVIKISVAPTFSIWAESIQGFWKAIGVDCIIDIQSNALIRSKMRSGELHCFRASWIADYPSPENYASLFYSKNGAPPNYTHFKDARVDSLYEQALTETQALATWKALDSIVVQSAQVIPIVYDEAWWFVSPKLKPLQPDAMNRLFFSELHLIDESE